MNDVADARASFREQAGIFSRNHNWVMCVLYVSSFGSFIGCSARFPLLTRMWFPQVNALQFAFLGLLVGALSRAGTGWMTDRYGGGRVTFWVFAGMIAPVALVIAATQAGSFTGFMALFFFTGVGNASTFQMIPVIVRKEIGRLVPLLGLDDARRQSDREAAAIIAFTGAIGAYGGFFIPKA